MNNIESIDNFKNFINSKLKFTKLEWEEGLQYLKTKSLKKGEFFIKQTQISKEAAFVSKGLLRTFHVNDQNKEITTFFDQENSFTIPYLSISKKLPSYASIQAVEDTDLVTISYTNLQKLFKKSPKWEKLGRISNENSFRNVSARLFMVTTLESYDRYVILENYKPDLIQRAQLKHIASYLNMTPETLSRIRQKRRDENYPLRTELKEFLDTFCYVA